MNVDLNPESQRVIDLALRSGAYHDSAEVIAVALSRLAKELPGETELQSHHESRSTPQAMNLVELSERVRGLLTDEEVDTLFRRNPSFSRPLDLE